MTTTTRRLFWFVTFSANDGASQKIFEKKVAAVRYAKWLAGLGYEDVTLWHGAVGGILAAKF